MKPTDEQVEAIECFKSGRSLKINAFAGTGKTSTLQLLAHATPKHGQYIAFNRSIVQDAKAKFPNSVNCTTTHGLAYGAVAPLFGNNGDKLRGRMSANQLAELLGLKRWRVDENHSLVPRSQGFLILETIKRFAQSADLEPTEKHVPRHGSLVAASEPSLAIVRDVAVRGAKHVWARMQDPKDPLPLGHDGYLKLWALGEPRINRDYILLDEAQDTNPVVLGVLAKQSAQMVYVGDRFQQIYEWRGAINAMEMIDTEHAAHLTTSFRFGQTIADAATRILAMLGETLPLRGNPNIESRIGASAVATILARTNASTITAVIDALDSGKKPYLVGGIGELIEMLKGVEQLKAGEPSNIPDFFGFTNWNEVIEFARSDEGAHLTTFVNLVEERGERQLMWALRKTVEEEDADMTISTAHKSKGREWNTVRLMDDFVSSRLEARRDSKATDKSGSDQAASELRLLYVALTRAKTAVDVPSSVLEAIGIPAPTGAERPAAATKRSKTEHRPRTAKPAPSWQPPPEWKPSVAATTQPSTSGRRDNPGSGPVGFIRRLFGR